MSESMTHPRSGWLTVATIGVALCVLAMLAVALVTIDKPHFGGMVGTWFLPLITGGMLVGGFVLFLSVWFLPERMSWRGITLLIWGLVAVTSPLFGIIFLLPWALLAVTLPLVIAILMKFRRTRREAATGTP